LEHVQPDELLLHRLPFEFGRQGDRTDVFPTSNGGPDEEGKIIPKGGGIGRLVVVPQATIAGLDTPPQFL
jgi:hypothetical protein